MLVKKNIFCYFYAYDAYSGNLFSYGWIDRSQLVKFSL